jgi:glyoxylase-like metal-dependent hydrolase (beta-lactamase superfamily II)
VSPLRIGDLEFWVVSDGQVTADAGGIFGLVPRSLYAEAHRPGPANDLPMNLCCLLIRSRERTILIDTGLGTKLRDEEAERWGLRRPEGGLTDALARVGITSDDVDIVVNTHLHWDHCGGNTLAGSEGLSATFPRATYWIQRLEWADACHPDARTRGTYLAENYTPLVKQGRVRFLHGDTEITDQIRCVLTRGHTRGHQSVQLTSGDWSGLYLADVATYAVQMTRTAWLTAYDVEPLENVRTKERWQRWALERNRWLFFEHDPKMTAARLVKRGGQLELEAVELARV